MTDEPVERVKTNLEIEEHLSMQERGWKVQKVGLYFIFAMVLAAAVGLYGDGPLSKRKLSQNNATVEFERFYRFEAQMELKVEVNAFTNADGLSVMFPAKYLDHFQVESILPEPEKTVVEGDQLVYLFSGSGISPSHII